MYSLRKFYNLSFEWYKAIQKNHYAMRFWQCCGSAFWPNLDPGPYTSNLYFEQIQMRILSPAVLQSNISTLVSSFRISNYVMTWLVLCAFGKIIWIYKKSNVVELKLNPLHQLSMFGANAEVSKYTISFLQASTNDEDRKPANQRKAKAHQKIRWKVRIWRINSKKLF